MMELSYTQHYSTAAGGAAHDPASSSSNSSSSPVDITFTATASATGSLLVGGSPCRPACLLLMINMLFCSRPAGWIP